MIPFSPSTRASFPYGISPDVEEDMVRAGHESAAPLLLILQARPWWTLRRCDHILYDGALHLVRGADGRRVIKPMDELANSLADVDTSIPLPHPGYRPGQVWRLTFRQVVMEDVLSWPAVRQLRSFGSQRIEDAVRRCNPILSYSQHLAGLDTRSSFDVAQLDQIPIFRFGGVDLTRDAFDQLFNAPLENVTPSLLADPCCPHLAPWNPATLDKASRSLEAVQAAWSRRTFRAVDSSGKTDEEVP